jgi:ribosomal protein S12 methylthiotransferase accessory factor
MVARQAHFHHDAGLKSYRLGTHRTVSPADTLARVEPHLRAMGITRIANVTGLDNVGIPVVMVVRPNSRSISVSQGKGVELAAAKASGVMEAVETYHAERITLPLKLAPFDALRDDHPMVDVSALPFSIESRYRDDRALLWIEGRNLMDDAPLWLPHELVHTDYTLPQPTGSGCFTANTNGLASGNHVLEAIAHGIYEVIERDAITLWRLEPRGIGGPPLELESVDDPTCRALLERFDAAGIVVRVWDVTSDVGVACFFCLVMDNRSDETEPEFGSGCHPVRQVALLRALTEAAQARTTFIAGSRDDFDAEIYSDAARAGRTRACRALLESDVPAQSLDDVPSYESNTLWDDIAWTLDRLRGVGVEQVAVVDLTLDRFGIPVVRVVIPGLEGVYKGEHSDYVPGERARAILGGAP